MLSWLSITSYGATLVTTFTTSYTAHPNEQSVTINFPSPPISEPWKFTILPPPDDPTSKWPTTMLMPLQPVLVLTDIVEVILSNNDRVLGTDTLTQSPLPQLATAQPTITITPNVVPITSSIATGSLPMTSVTSSIVQSTSRLIPTTFSTVAGLPPSSTDTSSMTACESSVPPCTLPSQSGGFSIPDEANTDMPTPVCVSFNCWGEGRQAGLMSIVAILSLVTLGFIIVWAFRRKPRYICGRRRLRASSNHTSQYDTESESEELSEEEVRRSGITSLPPTGLMNAPAYRAVQYPIQEIYEHPKYEPKWDQFLIPPHPNPPPPSNTSVKDWAYPATDVGIYEKTCSDMKPQS
ncbi:hypothetical protein BDZ45DRAFT_313273 [Acephala macrosclerotiorum]|nr:hypothetical protein BDZ45DRAFT_313273 [Acephala macrosclerotiorum]